MNLSNLIDRWRQRNGAVTPSPAATIRKPAPAPFSLPPSVAPVPPAATVALAEPIEDDDMNMGSVLEEFQAIQAMLRNEENDVPIPCRAALAGLPEHLRGPLWQASGFPDAKLHVDRLDLVEQLSHGRVRLSAASLADDLPAGWLAAGADADIDLSLREVVAAMPPELLQASSALSEAATRASSMRDLFTPCRRPQEAVETPPAPVEPVARMEHKVSQDVSEERHIEAADVAVRPREEDSPVLPPVTPPARPAKAPNTVAASRSVHTRTPTPIEPPGDWDGVERGLDQAPLGVDVNTADVEKLAALPGVGPIRAEAIVEHRQRHGRFANIFQLAGIPGIGASVFRQMTGLSLHAKTNRHERLKVMLDLPADGRAGFSRIVEAFAEKLSASGALVTNYEGICLVGCGVAAEKKGHYAALGAQLAKRSRSYVERINDGDANCILIPARESCVMLVWGDSALIVLTFDHPSVPSRIVRKAQSLAAETGWLLSRRAIVREW